MCEIYIIKKMYIKYVYITYTKIYIEFDTM